MTDDKNEKSGDGISEEEYERYSVDLQLRWPYNRKAFQLLSAMKGEDPRRYVEFARSARPFEAGCVGYFKGNLFPAACNNIGIWGQEHVLETGFANKAEYQDWMRRTRFPIIKTWIARCRPKLLICSGITYVRDFLAMAEVHDVPEPHIVTVNGHDKRIYVSKTGLVPIVVTPHLSGGPHSLNSYQAISDTAEYIKVCFPDMQF